MPADPPRCYNSRVKWQLLPGGELIQQGLSDLEAAAETVPSLLVSIGAPRLRSLDPYSQALAKIERGHTKDVTDVRSMLDDELIEPPRLRELFDEIEPRLYRYPAIDPAAFRRALEAFLEEIR